MNAKTKNRIINLCREENIGVIFQETKGIVKFYQLDENGNSDIFPDTTGRIVGNKILELTCHVASYNKFYNKLFNIINQINKEV